MRFTEHKFLVPIKYGDTRHDVGNEKFGMLDLKLYAEFGGFTDLGRCKGTWKDDSGHCVYDECFVYAVAFDLDSSVMCTRFAELMIWVKREFAQQCIYCTYNNAALL